jgi:phage tail sheath protein FI
MARKFKFVSPGIHLREVDESVIPPVPQAAGPTIIGRTRRGPSLVPTKVNTYSEFVEIFGAPVPGGATGGDVWRHENLSSPTYAAYAAQAWLANNSPCTIVRLAGAAHDDNDGDGGLAGWKTRKTATALPSTNGGAYGLFIWSSGSVGENPKSKYLPAGYPAEMPIVQGNVAGTPLTTMRTGTLAAVWYLQEGALTLSGTMMTTGSVTVLTSAASALIQSTANQTSGGEWKVEVRNTAGAVTETKSFSFNRNSPDFVRNVWNTSPVVTSDRATYVDTDSVKKYWLGESYESNVLRLDQPDGTLVGAIMALKNGTADGGTFTDEVARAETGWFIAQDLNSAPSGSFYAPAQQKLFKFKALPAGGEWDQRNLKISISDIAYSINDDAAPYGSFTVLIRDAKDTDAEPNILEAFTGVNLNPNSPNFITRRIGDKDMTWDGVKRTYRTIGNYENVSDYVTVDVSSDVENANVDARSLPFGFIGPTKYQGLTMITNVTGADYNPNTSTFLTCKSNAIPFAANALFATHHYYLATACNKSVSAASANVINIATASAMPLKFPSLEGFLRLSASAGGRLGDITDAYFGIQTDISRGASQTFDKSYYDLVRKQPKGLDSFSAVAGTTEASFVFTLDNVSASGDFNSLTDASYVSGSRRAGLSMTAVSASDTGYKEVLDAGFNKFTAPVHGGTDGVDITEMDPFNNAAINLGGGGAPTELNSYEYNSIRRAIDSVSDAERVVMNIAALPGVEVSSLTQHLINVCEARGDSLAVIDIAHGYTPRAESNAALSTRVGDVKQAINVFRARKINSSYGCAYYPWVQIVDSENEARIWVPPSIAALGTFASSERSTALWFAPAGFNRGGLTQGSAGINVNAVDGQLISKDRDKLYAINVNPIASFPAEGIVIFGQKTLQATPSALDRINVRRLLIYVKRQISAIAATTLFEQNVDATWNNFTSRARTFLDSVKVGGGLTDFRVLLDETTTTPDLIDRNILYAKVFLKPARAIEFIAVDFVIKRTGASFDD